MNNFALIQKEKDSCKSKIPHKLLEECIRCDHHQLSTAATYLSSALTTLERLPINKLHIEYGRKHNIVPSQERSQVDTQFSLMREAKWIHLPTLLVVGSISVTLASASCEFAVAKLIAALFSAATSSRSRALKCLKC